MTDNLPDIRGRVFSGAQPSGNMHLGNYLGESFKNIMNVFIVLLIFML